MLINLIKLFWSQLVALEVQGKSEIVKKHQKKWKESTVKGKDLDQVHLDYQNLQIFFFGLSFLLPTQVKL